MKNLFSKLKFKQKEAVYVDPGRIDIIRKLLEDITPKMEEAITSIETTGTMSPHMRVDIPGVITMFVVPAGEWTNFRKQYALVVVCSRYSEFVAIIDEWMRAIMEHGHTQSRSLKLSAGAFNGAFPKQLEHLPDYVETSSGQLEFMPGSTSKVTFVWDHIQID